MSGLLRKEPGYIPGVGGGWLAVTARPGVGSRLVVGFVRRTQFIVQRAQFVRRVEANRLPGGRYAAVRGVRFAQ